MIDMEYVMRLIEEERRKRRNRELRDALKKTTSEELIRSLSQSGLFPQNRANRNLVKAN